MFRRVLIFALGLLALLVLATPLWAQAAGPLAPHSVNLAEFVRGSGYFLSLARVLACWLLFLCWAGSTDWVSRDSQSMELDYLRWNPIVAGSFFATFLLMLLIPWFWLGYPLLVIAYVAPLTTYILYRNRHVSPELRVLTPDHLRFVLSVWAAKVGIKIAVESHDPNSGGAPVKLFARGGTDPQVDAARLLAARRVPGLSDARTILSDALAARASALMLDCTAAGVAVRHMVDGVWMVREPLERELGDPAVESLKVLCGLNPQDRRARQEGKFGLEYFVIKPVIFERVEKARKAFVEKQTVDFTKKLASDELPPEQLQQQVAAAVEERVREKFASPIGVWTPVDRDRLPRLEGVEALNPTGSLEPVKCLATLAAQGTATAERVLVQFETKAARLATLDDLGMRSKLQEPFKEVLGQPKGFVLLSAPPAGGLRSTTNVVLRSLDRFTRECVAVEEAGNRYEEVENIPVTVYHAQQENPAAILPKLYREQPQVVIIRDLPDAATVSVLCQDIVQEGRLVISTMRAKDCAEALVRVLLLKVPPAEFAAQATGVLCQRLVRKLCDKCKEAYLPPPDVLRQLGIPEGRVRALFRPPTPKADDDKKSMCPECGGNGYKGQTAIFELLVLDDNVRRVLATTPKVDLVRQAARKAGMKSLQEEGILLVARGVTSVPELLRVLKQ